MELWSKVDQVFTIVCAFVGEIFFHFLYCRLSSPYCELWTCSLGSPVWLHFLNIHTVFWFCLLKRHCLCSCSKNGYTTVKFTVSPDDFGYIGHTRDQLGSYEHPQGWEDCRRQKLPVLEHSCYLGCNLGYIRITAIYSYTKYCIFCIFAVNCIKWEGFLDEMWF